MKKLIYLVLLVSVVSAGACKTGQKNPGTDTPGVPDTIEKPDTMNKTTMGVVSMDAIAEQYLNLKNSLGEDNSGGASKAGVRLKSILNEYYTALPATTGIDSMKELISDAIEHADHIGESQGNIAHQREHFDFLSRDMYDLLKKEDGHKELYKVKCPMFNEGKGAFWISENGDNRNPYFGKSMPADGVNGEKI